MILRNSNNKPGMLQIPLKSSNLNWRPLICTTEKYLTFFFKEKWFLETKHANVLATEQKRTCIIGNNHLARITKRSFRTGEERNFVIFKG